MQLRILTFFTLPSPTNLPPCSLSHSSTTCTLSLYLFLSSITSQLFHFFFIFFSWVFIFHLLFDSFCFAYALNIIIFWFMIFFNPPVPVEGSGNQPEQRSGNQEFGRQVNIIGPSRFTKLLK